MNFRSLQKIVAESRQVSARVTLEKSPETAVFLYQRSLTAISGGILIRGEYFNSRSDLCYRIDLELFSRGAGHVPRMQVSESDPRASFKPRSLEIDSSANLNRSIFRWGDSGAWQRANGFLYSSATLPYGIISHLTENPKLDEVAPRLTMNLANFDDQCVEVIEVQLNFDSQDRIQAELRTRNRERAEFLEFSKAGFQLLTWEGLMKPLCGTERSYGRMDFSYEGPP